MSDDDLVSYIEDFVRIATESKQISLIMIYDDDDPLSHRQFRYFKENTIIVLDVSNRILPIERRSKLGRRFIDESRRYSMKMDDDKLKIEFTPTFLDFKTHKICLVGFHTVDELKTVIS